MGAVPLVAVLLQAEEIEALEAIFGPDWIPVDPSANTFSVRLNVGASSRFDLRLILPAGYPSRRAPVFELDAAWQSRPEAAEIADNLERIFLEAVSEAHSPVRIGGVSRVCSQAATICRAPRRVAW